MKLIPIILILLFPKTIFPQWISLSTSTTSNLRAVCIDNNSTVYAAGENGVMIKSTNGGISWSNLLNGGVTEDFNSLYFFSPAIGIACANGGKIIRTTNAGVTWTLVPSGVTDNLYSISFSNGRGICTGSGKTILYSSNSGSDWKVAESGFLGAYYGADMFSESIAYACGVNAIFQPFMAKSTNGGVGWDFSSFYLNGNEGNLSGIKFISETEGFASGRVFNGQGSVSHTSNGGADWDTQLFPFQLHGMDFTGMNTGFTAGENGLILKTTNQGLNWNSQSSPVSSDLHSVFVVDSLTCFIAGDGGVILKTTNGGLSAVENFQQVIADEFILEQNYPNPFNPTTIIKFENIDLQFVKLSIFDALGREIETLINEELKRGVYNIVFDGSNYYSGVYFYKMTAGENSVTKSMLLIK